jgi:uncharacterized tellurite resistance protein B-like protein
VRRWFTLYFIPVIPLGILGAYVECSGCHNTYDPTMTFRTRDEYGSSQLEIRAEYQNGVRNIMILLMLADGAIDDSEMRVIQDIYSEVAGEDYPRSALEEDIQRVRSQSENMIDYAKRINGLLNGQGKNLVIRAAISVALADGRLDKKEEKMIYRLGKELEFGKSAIKEYLSAGHSV